MPDMSDRLKRVRNEMVVNSSSLTLEWDKNFDGIEVVRHRYYMMHKVLWSQEAYLFIYDVFLLFIYLHLWVAYNAIGSIMIVP